MIVLMKVDVLISSCPLCGADPFKRFLPGLVQRKKRRFWGLGRERPYCAVICSTCKKIIGYENGPDDEIAELEMSK